MLRRPSSLVAVLRLIVAAGLLFAVLGPAAVAARAADVTFDRPTAEATFGESLTFTVEMTAATSPERIELELWFPGAVGPLLVPVPGADAGTGSRILEHVWRIGEEGHLLPNTVVRSRWVAHAADGTAARSEFVSVRYADTRFTWQTIEGDVVRVHWHAGDGAFGRRALEIGERAVAETSALLGVRETEPIDFFIYANTDEFREALGPGTRENVGGQANAEIRTLFGLIEPGQIDDAWVSIVIPHELVHLVFDTTVSNPYRYPPVWLNEGLAVYLSEGYSPPDQQRVEAAVADGTLMPLDALVGSFPRQGERIPLAYAEGASAVHFLVEEHGRDALVTLVRAYREGVTDDEAFTQAIGMDADAFQDEWLAWLGAEEPERYGPNPAPRGPLPPGWAAAGETPGPTGTPGGATPAPTPAASPVAGDAGAGGGSPLLLGASLAAGAAVVVAIVLRRRRP